MTKVGNFEKFKNKEKLTNIYKLINEMNLWGEFKTYEEMSMFDGRFTKFFWECGKCDIDTDEESLGIMKYIANNGWKDFVSNYNK